jgi:hypothetical protein
MVKRTLVSAFAVLAFLCGCNESEEVSQPRPSVTPDMAISHDQGVGSDNGPSPILGPPSIVVQPESILFSDVRVEEVASASISIANQGTGPLLIRQLTISDTVGPGSPEFKPGAMWESESVVVEPDQFRSLELRYVPTDYVTDKGTLRITSNDPDRPEIEIRIETISAYMDLEAPQSMRFGTVEVGQKETRRITLYNRGLDALTIESIELMGQGSFSLNFEATGSVPAVLARGEDLIFDILYEPIDDAPDRGQVVVRSDDPDQAEHVISLLGNESTPCLFSNQTQIDFGNVALDTPTSVELTVVNCSNALPLTLTAVEMTDDGGGIFDSEQAFVLPSEIDARDKRVVTVTVRPSEVGEWSGTLQLSSDDPNSPTLIPVRVLADGS